MGLFANIKALWENRKVLGPVSDAVMEIKASAIKDGWKTSEFYGKTLVQLFTLVAMFKPELGLKPEMALQIIAVVEALYHAFRVIVKTNPPTTVTVFPAPAVVAPVAPVTAPIN